MQPSSLTKLKLEPILLNRIGIIGQSCFLNNTTKLLISFI